ncbi:leucine-rich repeat domain-containing protein [Treponema sp. Marseille-Q4132]|uniref:leucine-rich repeat domain-containing protein n=1 Tax=Treponema sp. Marseille-Q4132 TaxID=2766701 RepID=UPI0016532F56|nr:leucine-rich repeat domain-containing protein [Treponema sp. Marseille-Q4132]QNL96838.1 leucine-rich repeat domain-containing protein [Treponema sp. Marseille-Q4132]
MTKRKDTKAKAFTCRGAEALITAALLAAVFLFTGCPQSPENQTQNPSVPPAEQKVTLTVAKGEHVQKAEPASLTVDKGSAWSAIKGNITVTYEAGWEAAGWKFDSAAGSDISDTTVFNENKTVVALAKAQVAPVPEKITITVTGGEHVTVHTENTFTADKGAVWQDIRSGAEALVTYEAGWEAAGWKFDSAAGSDISDTTVFNENKTVVALAKAQGAPVPEKITITVTGGEHVTVHTKNTFTADKGAVWQDIRSGAEALVTYETGWENEGWKFDDAAGIDVNDAALFNENKTVFASAKPLVNPNLRIEGGVLKGYNETPSGALVIPAGVTEIAECAFENCTEITGTVVLPASLKHIDWGAFKNCNKVTAFDFTQCIQLTSIGYEAFKNCKADAVFTVKAGGNRKNLLLNSKSDIKASQITEVP